MKYGTMPTVNDEEKKRMEEQLEHLDLQADPFFDDEKAGKEETSPQTAHTAARKARKGGYDKRVTTYLTEEMAALVDEICMNNGITPAAAGRMAFSLFVQKYGDR